ncbi:MAG: hypothetical protein ACMUIG_08420 [Thermoplasmatota archaeon]
MQGDVRSYHPLIGRAATVLLIIIMMISPLSILAAGGGGSAGDEAPTRAGEMGTWEKFPGWPVGLETGRCFVMHREAQNELVIFNWRGGQSSGSMEVYSYFPDTTTWIKRTTSGDIPNYQNYYRAFASNDEADTAFFFGGYDGNNYRDDFHVFFYSNMTWVQYDLPDAPSDRLQSSMVYDTTRDSIWVFGGRLPGWAGRTNEIYQFNFADGWTQHSDDDGMGGRDEALMTIDTSDSTIYIALGQYQTNPERFFNDLWSYDIGSDSWTQIDNDLGIPIESGSLFYPVNSTHLIMSMGFYESRDFEHNRTYIVDTSDGSWEMVYLPPEISARTVWGWDMLSDERTALIFGSLENHGDIWLIDIVDLTAVEMNGSPHWSGGTAITGYDPEDGGKLLALKLKFTGPGGTELAYYSISEGKWHGLPVDHNPSPEIRDYMSGCYDPVDNVFYVYGGELSYRVSQWEWHYYFYNQFWRLWVNNGTWERINVNAPPGKLSRASMTVDTESEYRHVYLYGGQTHNGESDAIAKWNITGRIWSVMNPPVEPLGRRQSALAYDPVKNGIWMYGGRQNSTSQELDDLWFFHINKELWEPLSGPLDNPEPRYGHSLAVNHDTGEVMVFGGDGENDPDMHIWRIGWPRWISVSTPTSPGSDWEYASMSYLPQLKQTVLWAGSGKGTEIWAYNPILRTIYEGASLFDPKGIETEDAFPTIGTYDLRLRGYTDLDLSDFLGINLTFKTAEDECRVTWYKANETIVAWGNTSWFHVDPGIIEMTIGNRFLIHLPITFTFDMPDNTGIDVYGTPLTSTAYTEERRTVEAFVMNSGIEIKGYQFYTELQGRVSEGGWIFGRNNITASGVEVLFSADPTVKPANSSFKITFANQKGDTDQWEFSSGEKGNLTVPVFGEDGEKSYYWLNLSTMDDEVIKTRSFVFNLDMDPPGMIEDVKIRADGPQDNLWGYDDDPEVFLTWGSIYENGSGIKGVCYSVNHNFWPKEQNLTNEFKRFQINSEGRHYVYVWAMDKTGRAGPYFKAPIFIDNHKVVFSNPVPDKPVRVTYPQFTVRINLSDDISGLDLDSIEYKITGEDHKFTDWMKYPHNFTDPFAKLTLTLNINLWPGITNYVQFRADDMVGAGYRESHVFAIFYDPNLKIPVMDITAPEDGFTTKDDVKFTWKGDYIQPGNLTYEVHITNPRGEEIVVQAGNLSEADFTPTYPGVYTWFIRGKADGKSNDSESRSFTFDPDFATIVDPSGISMKSGETTLLSFDITNTLLVGINLTFSLSGGTGITIASGDELALSAGETGQAEIILDSTGVNPGDYTVTVRIEDDFGRSESINVPVKILKGDTQGPDDEKEKDNTWLYIIIAVVAILVILVIVVIVVVMKRGGEEEEEEIEEEEEVSDEYDPTGVIAQGETVQASVPMSPGMPGSEDELRSGGTNLLEMEVPAYGDEPSPEEGPIEEAPEPPRKKVKKKKAKKPVKKTEEVPKEELEIFPDEEYEEIEDLEELEE